MDKHSQVDDVILKAYEFAKSKHYTQLDDEGKDYFTSHIVVVAEITKMLTNDCNVIASAYLHDVLEDTNTTENELLIEFGPVITNLVLELTHEGKADNKGYFFPRLKTKEAIMIKFIDRASNISRMDGWDEERRQHYLKKSKFWRD